MKLVGTDAQKLLVVQSEAVRFPDEAAVRRLAQRLAALAPGTTIDWSDSWSDADLREFTAASLKRLEAEEEEEPR